MYRYTTNWPPLCHAPPPIFRFEIDETSPSMSGCCGDDCSYEILSRRTKHGEASAGHTHGGGHCGGCCHWSASVTPFMIGYKSQQLSWLCVKAWAACYSASILSLNGCRWTGGGIPGYRYWCRNMEWDLCVVFFFFVCVCVPAAKAVCSVSFHT